MFPVWVLCWLAISSVTHINAEHFTDTRFDLQRMIQSFNFNITFNAFDPEAVKAQIEEICRQATMLMDELAELQIKIANASDFNFGANWTDISSLISSLNDSRLQYNDLAAFADEVQLGIDQRSTILQCFAESDCVTGSIPPGFGTTPQYIPPLCDSPQSGNTTIIVTNSYPVVSSSSTLSVPSTNQNCSWLLDTRDNALGVQFYPPDQYSVNITGSANIIFIDDDSKQTIWSITSSQKPLILMDRPFPRVRMTAQALGSSTISYTLSFQPVDRCIGVNCGRGTCKANQLNVQLHCECDPCWSHIVEGDTTTACLIELDNCATADCSSVSGANPPGECRPDDQCVGHCYCAPGYNVSSIFCP